jgi:hypothetical protein
MERGERARNGRSASDEREGGFDSAWMRRIEAEAVRVARSHRMPEERARAVAQSVAIALWQRHAGRPPEPGARSPEPGARSPEPGALPLTTSRGSSVRKFARIFETSSANDSFPVA